MTAQIVRGNVKVVVRRVVEHSPRTFGVPLDHWTVRDLTRYIRAMGIDCSTGTVHNALKDLGARHLSMNPDRPPWRARATARSVIQTAIAEKGVWFVDETRVSLGPLSAGYTLGAPTGRVATVEPLDTRAIHLLGGLSSEGALAYAIQDKPINSMEFAGWVKRLPSIKMVVCDMAAIHTSEFTRKELGSLLVLLPARTGSYNPIEAVWGILQGHLMGARMEGALALRARTEYSMGLIKHDSATLGCILTSYMNRPDPF